MICMDSDAAIAAFQKNPPSNIAQLREKVLYFLRSNSGMRIMFPTVALSEYVWRADLVDLKSAIRQAVGGSMFAPGFNDSTAISAADLGREYSRGGTLSTFLRQLNYDRVAFKADLLIVATAMEHQPKHFLTRDENCHALALFAGLDSRLITALPDPPPPTSPPPPPAIVQPRNMFDLFEEHEKGEEPKPG